MLKITTRIEATGTVFELEGKLAGPWVQELEKCWRKMPESDRSVRVLLCVVSFIDDKGRELLAKMYRHGVALVAEGCMNKAVIEEIMGREQG